MSGMTREEAKRYWEVFLIEIEELKQTYSDIDWEEQEQATKIAIADMEKQISKVVINKDDFYDYAECPSCKSPARDFLGCLYGYCRKCGQRLKVGEEND